jgi:hypothetical protein
MVNLFILALVVGLVALIAGIAGGKDRYAKMSEAEFEAEAQRASLLGAAVTSLHKFLQPTRVEYMMQRDKRVEGEQVVSGDPPSHESSEPPIARK